MDEILTIKQRLKRAEEMKYTDEIEHLRNENILKVLSYKQRWKIYPSWRMQHINIPKMKLLSLKILVKILLTFLLKSQKELSMLTMSDLEIQDISDNKIGSPNPFESLSLSHDDRDVFSSNKHAFFPTNIKDKSVRLRNLSTKPDTL